MRLLRQVSHTEISTIDNLTAISRIYSRKNIQQGSLTGSVLRNETDTLPLCYTEGDILKKNTIPYPTREFFDL